MEKTENPKKIEEELKIDNQLTIKIKTLDNQVYTFTVPKNVHTLKRPKLHHHVDIN